MVGALQRWQVVCFGGVIVVVGVFGFGLVVPMWPFGLPG